MSIYSIYKITNKINNKVYIGFTQNIERRMLNHFKCNHNKGDLKKEINVVGEVNFKFEVLYQSKDKNYCLNIMEPYFIKEYDSVVNGYNRFKGGGQSRNDKPFELTNNDYEKLLKLFN